MKGHEVKIVRHARRKHSIRNRLRGTAACPRLTVFRSLQHTYAQLIDDDAGATLCSASTRDKDLRTSIPKGGDIGAAKAIGTALAERAKSKNIGRICFDRNGYRYHGRIKALADAAREAGLKF